MKTWLDYKYNEEDRLYIDVNAPIFNNSYVRFKRNTIFIERCIGKSMVLIKDFIENDEIITFDSFCNIFGKNAETQFAYNIIYNALKKIEKDIKDNLKIQREKPSAKCIIFKNVEVGGISRKAYYNMINHKHVVSVISKYRTEFLIEEHDSLVWQIAPCCSSEVKLIQLQWKILHNIYPTGSLLYKMKIRPTENCEFCGEYDSLSHFFANCLIAKRV